VATIAGDTARFTVFGVGNVRTVRRGQGLVRIEYPTAETKEHCLRHYLQRKNIEYAFAATASRDQLLNDPNLGLRCDVSAYEQVAGLDAVSHLQLWASVLD
jgi:hypothetical protein